MRPYGYTYRTPARDGALHVMPFALKNGRATYQYMITSVFKLLLGKTMKVYIDNMLLKSGSRGDHLIRLKEAI